MNIKPLRTAKALFSLAQLVRDPDKLDQVFEMADALADPKRLAVLVERLARDPKVARSMDERHRFRISLAELRTLPDGSLGRVFADRMITAGLDPSALPDLPATDRASFFRAHLYETHDVWHTVADFGMDRFGEIGLQGFYLAQIGGPLPALLLAVGFLRVAIYEQDKGRTMMDEVERGYRMGKGAQPLFGVHWDELWHLPLTEVRRRLGIEIGERPVAARTSLAA